MKAFYAIKGGNTCLTCILEIKPAALCQNKLRYINKQHFLDVWPRMYFSKKCFTGTSMNCIDFDILQVSSFPASGNFCRS